MQHGVHAIIAALFAFSFGVPEETSADALPLPASDANFVSAHFSGSANCGACHNGLRDPEGNDVSLERDWRITMMANASRDPLWQAKVASELKRNPQLGAEINAGCTRCHAPMANVEAEAVGRELAIFEDGLINPSHPLFDAAMDGVSCTLCHQIDDNGELGTDDAASGRFAINLDERLAYGPKLLPRVNPMLTETGFTPTHGAHMSGSEVCGTCHDLRTNFVDGDGEPVDTDTVHGGFPEQMAYTEWEHSAYAPGRRFDRSCQDCHMPETDGVKLANRPRWLAPVDNFSRHGFLGANTVMLSMLDANSEELGVTEADFTPAIERSRENLAGAAELGVQRHEIVDGRLKVWLTVHNLSGHKLPTGYPSRRVYLHFTVRDQSGKVIFESGRMNADGSIVGVDADRDPSTFEPHRKFINRKNQVQVYEAVMGNTDGQVTHTLLEASHYLKDNRLPPAGFDKNKVPDEIAVRGVAETDANFNFAWDTIRYAVTLPEGKPGDILEVEVELNYQPLSYAYLQDLFEDAEQPAVARFKRMYENSTLRKETIDRIVFDVVR